jgi:hypothetical protein
MFWFSIFSVLLADREKGVLLADTTTTWPFIPNKLGRLEIKPKRDDKQGNT